MVPANVREKLKSKEATSTASAGVTRVSTLNESSLYQVKQSARGLENTWGESDKVALFSSVAEYWTRGYHYIFPCWGTLGFVDEEVSQQGTASDLKEKLLGTEFIHLLGTSPNNPDEEMFCTETTQVGLALRLQEGPMAGIARTTSDEVLTQALKNTIKPYVEPQRAGRFSSRSSVSSYRTHTSTHAPTHEPIRTQTHTQDAIQGLQNPRLSST